MTEQPDWLEPGTDEARDAGCRCSVHIFHAVPGGSLYTFHEGCPVHGRWIGARVRAESDRERCVG